MAPSILYPRHLACLTLALSLMKQSGKEHAFIDAHWSPPPFMDPSKSSGPQQKWRPKPDYGLRQSFSQILCYRYRCQCAQILISGQLEALGQLFSDLEQILPLTSVCRMTNCHSLLRTFLVLALKVPCARKLLSLRQTRMVGAPPVCHTQNLSVP